MTKGISISIDEHGCCARLFYHNLGFKKEYDEKKTLTKILSEGLN